MGSELGLKLQNRFARIALAAVCKTTVDPPQVSNMGRSKLDEVTGARNGNPRMLRPNLRPPRWNLITSFLTVRRILYPNSQIFYLMEDFFQEGIGDSPISLFVFFIFNQPQQL